jgi:hypothetical protein
MNRRRKTAPPKVKNHIGRIAHVGLPREPLEGGQLEIILRRKERLKGRQKKNILPGHWKFIVSYVDA